MHRPLITHGFILILLSLLSAFLIPSMAVPRLGLSAHTIGLLGGVLMIAVGGVWPVFSLGRTAGRVMAGGWSLANYSNWLGCLIGGWFGAGRATPIASDGFIGSTATEATVGALLLLAVVAAMIAVSLSFWGLRPSAAAKPDTV